MDVECELAPEHTSIPFTCAPEHCTTFAHVSVSAGIPPPWNVRPPQLRVRTVGIPSFKLPPTCDWSPTSLRATLVRILRRTSMRSDIDDLAEETFFALEEEANRASGGGWRLTQAQGNLVAAHVALGNALTGRDVAGQIARAQTFLRQAVQHQSGLSSSAGRALAAIQRGDLGRALAIVRGMYPLVGGGAA